MLFAEGRYFWYGENRDEPPTGEPTTSFLGIACYSSVDLLNWRNEGIVLAPQGQEEDELHASRVGERPKVLYNEATRTYVMWLHVDDHSYRYARAGVAVAASPTGPFEYRRSFRPGGRSSTDLTVYMDRDGSAYLISGVDWHSAIQVIRLTPDFLEPIDASATTHLPHPGPPSGREAPAVFRRRDRYYMITSGTTGWAPNRCASAVADNLNGPWIDRGDPCVGPGSELTFGAQSAFVIEREGLAAIAMFDRWQPMELGRSRYVWLPIEFRGEDLVIRWRDDWSPWGPQG